ncbi:substrate-binding domain-containing protein [Larkinella knui]|uniref:LacI family DNA-binding transcriptional regulator n=1 Tax=Larkinella knui TaxID=2025310 RepID=A0A3P1C9C4_9BACT|nr:substrate-binding domain-containing protein [Larkinella knui]RRB09912.1 LacI family DNA-binding transcriptional regulator [Larkinella knui]
MKKKELQGVKEIARRANVTIATVDRVIHNRAGVSVKTREKITKIIEELNYQPNMLARRLASGKIIKLAVLIPSVTEETEFWDAPLRGIQRAKTEISQYGLQVDSFFFDLSNKQSFIDQANAILESAVDGIVLAPTFIQEARTFAAACNTKGIPYVFIDSTLPDQQNLSYIGPPLFQSGYLAGKLSTYALREKSQLLVVNIATAIESYTYKETEEGFRAYFTDHLKPYPILRVDIHQTDEKSVFRNLQPLFESNPAIDALFVTNSRSFLVARFLEKMNPAPKPLLIGYDLVKENAKYLDNGLIDFLICHQPEDQGYRSIMTLYQFLIFSKAIDKEQYMPIDIVTRENQAFYRN